MTNTIYTTTSALAEIADRVGSAQQRLVGGAERKTIAAELEAALDALHELIDTATSAAAERQRRETQHQATGAITFPNAG